MRSSGRILCLLCFAPLIAGGPAVTFSTYLGIADCDDVAQGPDGNIYLACHSPDDRLPVPARPPRDATGDMDAYVIRLDPRARKVVWATRLAGRDYDGAGRIRIDRSGFIYVTGFTKSPDFPTTADAVQPRFGGGEFDAFVVKLTPDGGVVYSTFLGGSGLDQGNALEVDGDGTVYVGGTTGSADFPAQAKRGVPSGHDAFVAALHPGRPGGLRSVVFGGTREEKLTGIALNHKGGIFAVGYTRSADFPVVHPVQNVLSGPMDLFLTRLDRSTLKPVFSTFFGGSGEDSGWGVTVDRRGSPVVAWITGSTDLPAGANAFQRERHGGTDAFVAVFSGRGYRRIHATYFGGSADDESGYDGGDIGVDPSGNIWLAGITMSPNLPLRNPIQSTFGGGAGDGFLAAFSPRLDRLCFATYLGGTDRDLLEGLKVSGEGVVTVTGLSLSHDMALPAPGIQDAKSQAVVAGKFNNFVFQLRAASVCAR
ncbi:MAG: hypothetical protein ACKV22_29975 [Bryobacteraceae bacterium]